MSADDPSVEYIPSLAKAPSAGSARQQQATAGSSNSTASYNNTTATARQSQPSSSNRRSVDPLADLGSLGSGLGGARGSSSIPPTSDRRAAVGGPSSSSFATSSSSSTSYSRRLETGGGGFDDLYRYTPTTTASAPSGVGGRQHAARKGPTSSAKADAKSSTPPAPDWGINNKAFQQQQREQQKDGEKEPSLERGGGGGGGSFVRSKRTSVQYASATFASGSRTTSPAPTNPAAGGGGGAARPARTTTRSADPMMGVGGGNSTTTTAGDTATRGSCTSKNLPPRATSRVRLAVPDSVGILSSEPSQAATSSSSSPRARESSPPTAEVTIPPSTRGPSSSSVPRQQTQSSSRSTYSTLRDAPPLPGTIAAAAAKPPFISSGRGTSFHHHHNNASSTATSTTTNSTAANAPITNHNKNTNAAPTHQKGARIDNTQQPIGSNSNSNHGSRSDCCSGGSWAMGREQSASNGGNGDSSTHLKSTAAVAGRKERGSSSSSTAKNTTRAGRSSSSSVATATASGGSSKPPRASNSSSAANTSASASVGPNPYLAHPHFDDADPKTFERIPSSSGGGGGITLGSGGSAPTSASPPPAPVVTAVGIPGLPVRTSVTSSNGHANALITSSPPPQQGGQQVLPATPIPSSSSSASASSAIPIRIEWLSLTQPAAGARRPTSVDSDGGELVHNQLHYDRRTTATTRLYYWSRNPFTGVVSAVPTFIKGRCVGEGPSDDDIEVVLGLRAALMDTPPAMADLSTLPPLPADDAETKVHALPMPVVAATTVVEGEFSNTSAFSRIASWCGGSPSPASSSANNLSSPPATAPTNTTANTNSTFIADFRPSIVDANFDTDLVHTYTVARVALDMVVGDLRALGVLGEEGRGGAGGNDDGGGDPKFANGWRWQWEEGGGDEDRDAASAASDQGVSRPSRRPLRIIAHAGSSGSNSSYLRGKRVLKFYQSVVAKPQHDQQQQQGTGTAAPTTPTMVRLYTCRSVDVVAHEVGHAILDSLCPAFYHYKREGEVAGLHEGFSDVVAIFSMVQNEGMRRYVMAALMAEWEMKVAERVRSGGDGDNNSKVRQSQTTPNNSTTMQPLLTLRTHSIAFLTAIGHQYANSTMTGILTATGDEDNADDDVPQEFLASPPPTGGAAVGTSSNSPGGFDDEAVLALIATAKRSIGAAAGIPRNATSATTTSNDDSASASSALSCGGCGVGIRDCNDHFGSAFGGGGVASASQGDTHSTHHNPTRIKGSECGVDCYSLANLFSCFVWDIVVDTFDGAMAELMEGEDGGDGDGMATAANGRPHRRRIDATDGASDEDTDVDEQTILDPDTGAVILRRIRNRPTVSRGDAMGGGRGTLAHPLPRRHTPPSPAVTAARFRKGCNTLAAVCEEVRRLLMAAIMSVYSYRTRKVLGQQQQQQVDHHRQMANSYYQQQPPQQQATPYRLDERGLFNEISVAMSSILTAAITAAADGATTVKGQAGRSQQQERPQRFSRNDAYDDDEDDCSDEDDYGYANSGRRRGGYAACRAQRGRGGGGGGRGGRGMATANSHASPPIIPMPLIRPETITTAARARELASAGKPRGEARTEVIRKMMGDF